jgi:serine/threonine-protein kinase RsbW
MLVLETGASLDHLDAMLDQARTWLEANAPASGDVQTLYLVELMICEALTNVIRHAYSPSRPGPVGLELVREQGGVVVRVRDQGRAFDPRLVKAPDLDSPREGGMGVYLIREIADSVDYESTPGGNVLTMTKGL